MPGHPGPLGGHHEHLGGNATPVQTGATEDRAFFDQGDVQVGETLIDDGVARTGSDHGNVEMLHAPILSCVTGPARHETEWTRR